MKKLLLRLKSVFLLPMLFLLLMAMSMVGIAQTVTLDQADLDYAPGETVGITGTGWQPGETVTLTVSNLTNPDVYCGATDPHLSWTIVADGSGDFSASWYVYDCELGANLVLIAESATGFTFELFFTDANPALSNLVVGTQTGTLTAGTAGSATYASSIKITGAGSPISITLSISGLPNGLSFSPLSISSIKNHQF